MPTSITSRYKAILAFLSTGVATLVALYQQNQNLTLKQVVAGIVAALIGGVIVHQVPNKGVTE